MTRTHSEPESPPVSLMIDRVLNGDSDSFQSILDRYQNYVFSIVHRHVPGNMVEDIAQEAFIRLFRALPNYKKGESFKPWLSTIVVRTCLDALRRSYRSKEIAVSMLGDHNRQLLDELSAEQAHDQYDRIIGRQETQELLDHVMAKLSPDERMVLELVHFEGFTGKEAAGMLDWSVAKVKVQTYRSRKKLQGFLNEMLSQGEAEGNE